MLGDTASNPGTALIAENDDMVAETTENSVAPRGSAWPR
jgi:hypothetical protein